MLQLNIYNNIGIRFIVIITKHPIQFVIYLAEHAYITKSKKDKSQKSSRKKQNMIYVLSLVPLKFVEPEGLV